MGFEDLRPIEGMYAPLKVRFELKQAFARWLPSTRNPRPFFGMDERVEESSLLDLCQYYRLAYVGGADDVAADWNNSVQRQAEGAPTFEELVSLCWIFFDGGRWVMQDAPIGTFAHITYPSPSTEEFLTGLSDLQFIAKTEIPPQHAQMLVDRIVSKDWLVHGIPVRDPNWLADQMWEKLCPNEPSDEKDDRGQSPQSGTSTKAELVDFSTSNDAEEAAIDSAFLEWSAWCHVLNCGGQWHGGWAPFEMECCRAAAHRVLERQTIWASWDSDAARYIDVLLNTYAIPHEQIRFARSPRLDAPLTAISRVDWMKWPDVEHCFMERLRSSTVSFAFGLLCTELETTGIGPRITVESSKVISFTLEHPMAMQHFLFRVGQIPALLVDMLMNQSAVCLAVRLAIEWRPQYGQLSDLNLKREAQTKEFAVQDALSFLAYHFSNGSLDLEECAALITWCYSNGSGGRAVADSRGLVGQLLLKLVSNGSEEQQTEVLQHLVSQAAYKDNIPRAQFGGVLDALERLKGALTTTAFPLASIYSKFAHDRHLDWTDVSGLSIEQSARLVATAFAQAPSIRNAMLVPIDSAKLLQETPERDRLSLYSSVAKTHREHVRLLARAIAGWLGDGIPDELCSALQTHISCGVFERVEDWCFGALTERYSASNIFGKGETGSPALDLAMAWRRLNVDNQTAMLQSFAESDDPVLLAELCQNLPAAAKPVLQGRLRQLKPGAASTPWTWTEIQHRIESLLAAGEVELAREHYAEALPNLEQAAPQIRVILFNTELQLLLKEKNWAAIDAASLPPSLNPDQARQAQSHLNFYKATSQLLRPAGDLSAALSMLQRLAAQPGAAPVYKQNAFAIAIQEIMGQTLRPLTGESKTKGEKLLSEINAALAANAALSSINLLANRALLLLALQRPDEALASLADFRRNKKSSDLEHVVVLAKFELGLRDEAMAILDAAITEFGDDQRLISLKKELEAGEAVHSVTTASAVLEPVSHIRAALQQLVELQPDHVGNVLGPTGEGARGYLTRQVSRALASLQHMAAMLRDRKDPEVEARHEDDLNTAVREVLTASLSVAKWDVADQSLGGSTESGNPGERDAVIKVSGQEIAVYEALVCSGLDRVKTKKHFDRLLSYGACNIFFHVTYSYAEKMSPLLEYVKEMLEHDAPARLDYRGCIPLGPPNHEVYGYAANYRDDHRDITVVFFIVDLRVR